MSDFIMTIDEDDDIQVYESDNEVEETKVIYIYILII